MSKFIAGIAYCPACKYKWVAVSYHQYDLQCPMCFEYIGHMLHIDRTGLVKRVTVDTTNVVEFKRPTGGEHA